MSNIGDQDLQPLVLSDTVYTWYNTTNQIIELINPLSIYNVIPEQGITFTKSGILNGTLTFSVLLKNNGGLVFKEDNSISLSASSLPTEIFTTSSSYKFFAQDSSGNIKAVTFDLNEGKGIDFVDGTNSLTIGINSSVVTLEDEQIILNKTLVEPKISNSSNPNLGVTLKSTANAANYTLTFPGSQGSSGQFLASDGGGLLKWVDAPLGSGGGPFSFRAESPVNTTIVVNSNEYLNFLGTTGINTSAVKDATTGGVPTLRISIDSTVATLTGVQTLSQKTLNSPVLLEPRIRIASDLVPKEMGVILKSSAFQTNVYSLTFPPALGTNGQYLRTDAIGNLNWHTPTFSGSSIFDIRADIGDTQSFNTSVNSLAIVGGIAIRTATFANDNNIEKQVVINLDTSKFTASSNLNVTTFDDSIRYSLDSTITGVTLNNSLFKNINYQYNNNNLDDAGPLYTLMNPNWDPTETENAHIIGQLVLVPIG